MSIAFKKVIFGEDYSSTEIPCKYFCFKENLHFSNLLIHALMLYSWSLLKIYHSYVGSIEICETLALIEPYPNIVAKHSMMQG
jgi:hypothetical protein